MAGSGKDYGGSETKFDRSYLLVSKTELGEMSITITYGPVKVKDLPPEFIEYLFGNLGCA
jgi:hypothetical protein